MRLPAHINGEEPVRLMIEADARRLLDSRSLPVMAERLISRRTVLGC